MWAVAEFVQSSIDESLAAVTLTTFRNLLTVNVVSDIGTFMQSVGAAWLIVSLNAGPMYVALIQTASALPFFVLALPGGGGRRHSRPAKNRPGHVDDRGGIAGCRVDTGRSEQFTKLAPVAWQRCGSRSDLSSAAINE